MKIWIINHYAITPDQAGGTRHFTFAKELQKLGHETTIICSNYDHFNGKHRHENLTEPKVEEVQGIKFVWIPTREYSGNGKQRALNMLDFSRGIKKIVHLPNLSNPDWILGSSPHLFTPWSAKKISKKMNVPFILEIRDVWPQTLVDLGNFSESSLFIKVLAWMEKKLYQTANHIIVLLPQAPQHCTNLGANSNNISWIPNGIDLSLSQPTEPEDKDSFTVMFAGAHGLANGLDTVIRAAKLVENENIKVRLLGDGPEKQKLINLSKDIKTNNIEFSDPVPKKQVYSELSKADAFVMCLKSSDVFRWGISPNKLYDYMACQRPIIFAVNSSNSPVEEAECGLRIEPDNPEAMAKAMRELKALPLNERKAMAKRGRDYVTKNHAFEVLASKLVKVGEKVLAKKQR